MWLSVLKKDGRKMQPPDAFHLRYQQVLHNCYKRFTRREIVGLKIFQVC